MEKPAAVKAKNKFLALLPKAAKAAANLRFEFENPIFSPGKDKRASANAANKHKSHQHRAYPGPITTVIFQQARSNSKNSRFAEAKEPTSPKISCMGQIKYKKKMSLKKQVSLPREAKHFSFLPRESRKKPSTVKTTEAVKKKALKNSRNIFSSIRKPEGRKSDVSAEVSRLPDTAPCLNQMKRFASSRETLSNFDWTRAQVAPEEGSKYHRRYYSDDDRDYSDGEDEQEEEEVIIPHSAPLQPKKEINLWKRRTLAQPKPLQLNKTG